jgi:trehalose 6-phosphate synthase/phosphatase
VSRNECDVLASQRTASAVSRDASESQPGPGPLIDGLRQSPSLTLLLDYDGTLVPVAPLPHLAAPNSDVHELLARLIASPGIDLHIVSGRLRATLDKWFGELPISLWAEHGFWHRGRGRRTWRSEMSPPPDWTMPVRPILEQFTADTPGSFIEEKTVSLAWHYRLAQQGMGPARARELRQRLLPFEDSHGLEVIDGRRVVEVRVRGVSKAAVARYLCRTGTADPIVAIGDDRTDEDLFAALPDTAFTIAVGTRPSRARFRLADSSAVRAWLDQLTR